MFAFYRTGQGQDGGQDEMVMVEWEWWWEVPAAFFCLSLPLLLCLCHTTLPCLYLPACLCLPYLFTFYFLPLLAFLYTAHTTACLPPPTCAFSRAVVNMRPKWHACLTVTHMCFALHACLLT